jgi:outer membrane protein OmpA-like peptidoglycan-associated protein
MSPAASPRSLTLLLAFIGAAAGGCRVEGEASVTAEPRELRGSASGSVTVEVPKVALPEGLKLEGNRIVRVAATSTVGSSPYATLDDVKFKLNSAEIDLDASRQLLETYATALRNNPALSIEIDGHTDSLGDAQGNLALSRARAESVREWFVANAGVAPESVSNVEGYGPTRPVRMACEAEAGEITCLGAIDYERNVVHVTCRAPDGTSRMRDVGVGEAPCRRDLCAVRYKSEIKSKGLAAACEQQVWSKNRRSEFVVTRGIETISTTPATTRRTEPARARPTPATPAAPKDPAFDKGLYVELDLGMAFVAEFGDRDGTSSRNGLRLDGRSGEGGPPSTQVQLGFDIGYLWVREGLGFSLGLELETGSYNWQPEDGGDSEVLFLFRAAPNLRLGPIWPRFFPYLHLSFPGIVAERVEGASLHTGVGLGMWGLIGERYFMGAEGGVDIDNTFASPNNGFLKLLLGWVF